MSVISVDGKEAFDKKYQTVPVFHLHYAIYSLDVCVVNI